MRETIEQRGSHLGIAKDAGPFSERQVGGDDDRGSFIELADEMEQELAACLSEGQIPQLIQDQEVEAGDEIGGSSLPFRACLGGQLVHQVDDVEEPAPPSFSDAGTGNADREVSFSSAGSTDQNQVALMVEEVSGSQITDQGLIDLCRFEVELVDLLCQWQLGDGHLVFDGPGLLLRDLGMQQIANDLLRFMLAFDGCRNDLVVSRPHAVELQLTHCAQDLRAFHAVFSSGCHIGRSWLQVHNPASARPGW